jgi:hypothetical protein
MAGVHGRRGSLCSKEITEVVEGVEHEGMYGHVEACGMNSVHFVAQF